jgi:hypothetical protein
MSQVQMIEGAFEDVANYAAARGGTFEVVSAVWGVRSTWTVKARNLPEANRKASEELRERSYGAYIVSVRRADAS